MTRHDITDPYMQKPTYTSMGKPWTQRCYVCTRIVDFTKMAAAQWIRVEQFVRHTKCDPPPLVK